MAEIKRPKPPTTISIPSREAEVVDETTMEKEILRVPTSADRTHSTSATGSSYGDHDETQRLIAKLSGPNSPASSPQFFVGTFSEEEEASIHSKFSLLDTEDLSYGELISLVERLYDGLKRADRALTKEQGRRSAREKSLIKLAKDLRERKDTITEYTERIEELEEELQVVRSERSLLEERLDLQLEYDKQKNDTDIDIMKAQLKEADRLYKKTCVEYDRKIHELNKCHGIQCEQLMREVILANREAIRLQNRLSEVSTSCGETIIQSEKVESQGRTALWDSPPYFVPPSRTWHGSESYSHHRKVLWSKNTAILLVVFFSGLVVGYLPVNWGYADENLYSQPGRSTVGIRRETQTWSDAQSKRRGNPLLYRYNIGSGRSGIKSRAFVTEVMAERNSKLSEPYNGGVVHMFILRLKRMLGFLRRLIQKVVVRKRKRGSENVVMERAFIEHYD